MAHELNGSRVAILAADGVERVELELPLGALLGVGARPEILSTHTGEIQARQSGLVPAGTLPVDRLVASAKPEDYDALLLPGGTINPDVLRNDCNAVAFGFVDTRLTQAKVDENVMEIGGEKVQLGIPEQMRGMASMMIPLGRPASPQEAAGGVFFLCTPWSNYVHGQVLNITGGLMAGMSL